jgi:hypothetical protein
MKHNLQRRSAGNRGSTLVAAAIAAAILSILIAGYLAYLTNAYRLGSRSDSWNDAMHLAEAGVELGMAEFNFPYQAGAGFASSNGWTSQGASTYKKTVTNFTDSANAVVGSISITVKSVGNNNPSILSVGTASGGVITAAVSRAVYAVLTSTKRYPMSILSRSTLNFNGNNVYTDSYDSTDPTKSTSGLYDVAKRQANGDLFNIDGTTDSTSIGNASIYGRILTTPSGTVTMGASGDVGPTFVSADRATTVADGNAKGYILYNVTEDIPSVNLPSGAASWSSVTVGHGPTTWNTGDYKTSSLGLASADQMNINGKVRFYVTGAASVGGSAKVTIKTGASLEIYVGGNVTISGGYTVNNTGSPGNNQWLGLPGSASWNVNGNGQWIGTIFAPDSDLTLTGGSAGDVSGSVVAKSLKFAGGTKIHYDEALGTIMNDGAYKLASWQEYNNNSGTWGP